jgi:hypothetical protein
VAYFNLTKCEANGNTYKQLWNFELPGTEAYCSLAVGYFDEDSIPDFFTNFGIGVFPDLLRSYQLAVSGKDGTLLKLDSLGSFHYASPVVYDINGDSRDEVFYHVNEYNMGAATNALHVFSFTDSVYKYDVSWPGANLGSTPFLGDLDGDGYLEIVYVNENNPADLFSLDYKTGISIHTLKTDIHIVNPIRWGSYMGSLYNGQFK